jgi:hypothetical protein
VIPESFICRSGLGKTWHGFATWHDYLHVRNPPVLAREADETQDMTSTQQLTVSAIDPTRLATIRTSGRDDNDNPVVAHNAEGWEPLRCCLTIAEAGHPIALIAYTPLTTRSPWTETGPVFICAEECSGYEADHELPARQRTGPKILRTYRADGTLNYDHITLVADGVDIGDQLVALLDQPDVSIVHVRAVLAQCFAYSVTID